MRSIFPVNEQFAKVFTWDSGNSAGELVGHTKRVLSGAFKVSQDTFQFCNNSRECVCVCVCVCVLISIVLCCVLMILYATVYFFV